MKPLNCPYIPEGKVFSMLVSHDMPDEMIKHLEKHVPVIVRTPALAGLPAPVNSHPDMQVVIPTEGVVVHAPHLKTRVIEALKNLGFILVPGSKAPSGNYPSDIPYNVAVVGHHAFLNTRFVDHQVLHWLKKTGKTISHVNQGYSKCSVCILNEEAVVTSDAGIYRVMREKNIDVLLIPPQKAISIPGYDYGFIGGSTGLISRKQLAVSGDIGNLDNGGQILAFLQKHGVEPIALSHAPVLDLGSLIPLCTV